MIPKTYSKLMRLDTFEERFAYLKLTGQVGTQTFGWDRPLNQLFYRSPQWKRIRNHIIVRDGGLDLGAEGYEILDKVVIHHMNPMLGQDLLDFNPDVLDPEFLITTSAGTHRAIHYGSESLIPRLPPERRPGDTRLW